MAITENNLTSGTAASGSSAATASFTPGSNRLVILAVHNKRAASPATPTVTGNSLTYVQIATVAFNSIAASTQRLTLFRALGASPSTGVATIDFGGVDQALGIAWSVCEFIGIDTSGTNGSGALVQSNTNRLDGTTSISTTLGALSNANNATYGWCGSNGGVFTVGSGYSAVHASFGFAGGTSVSEWRATGSTTVDTTCDSGTFEAIIGIEIAIASGSWGKLLGQELNRLVVP